MLLKKTVTIFLFFIALFNITLIAQTQKTYVLSLQDAIFLALRNNPTIQSSELDRITQKYALVVEKNFFKPQYALDASFQHSSVTFDGEKNSSDQLNVTPSVSLNTHYGTKITLSADNPTTFHDDYNPAITLAIQQPLIKGFGKAIVDAALNNALDNEEINQLMLKNTIIITVNNVINQYLSLIQAQETLKIDQESLNAYEDTIQHTQSLITAGRLPRSDLVQTETQLAIKQADIQNDLNNVSQARLRLLDIIGLDSTTQFQLPENVDFEMIINKILGNQPLPAIEICKQMALKNNPSYQQNGISLKILERAVMTAKDNHRWSLNLTAQKTIGGGLDNESDLSDLFDNYHQNQSVNLTLSIPINDVSAKQAILNAKIALDKAKLAYKESKRLLEMDVMNAYNTVLSNKTRLGLSKQALKLQKRTVEVAQLKQQAGRTSMFELLNTQKDLTISKQTVITTMISYINALAGFDQILGTTLRHWNIHLQQYL